MTDIPVNAQTVNCSTLGRWDVKWASNNNSLVCRIFVPTEPAAISLNQNSPSATFYSPNAQVIGYAVETLDGRTIFTPSSSTSTESVDKTIVTITDSYLIDTVNSDAIFVFTAGATQSPHAGDSDSAPAPIHTGNSSVLDFLAWDGTPRSATLAAPTYDGSFHVNDADWVVTDPTQGNAVTKINNIRILGTDNCTILCKNRMHPHTSRRLSSY